MEIFLGSGFCNVDHLYYVRDGLKVAEQKDTPTWTWLVDRQ